MRGIRSSIRRLTRGMLAVAVTAAAAASVAAESAEDRFADVEVKAQPVSDNVYMLTGAGGNIGVSVGADGTLIIDDQYAPLAERIVAALKSIDGGAPKLVLNTHFHGDHTGSNPIFGELATIVAHDNVRARLASQEDFPAGGLPVLTYSETVKVHFNGDTLKVMHLPAGHTDGDSVVWFERANVLHAGDLLFKDRFPFIDQANGGSVPGVIVNLTRLVDMLPEDVAIIPGHGPLADRTDLEATLGMIRATRAEVMEALGEGQSVEEVVAAGLGPQWESWGSGFINEERWIRTLAASGP